MVKEVDRNIIAGHGFVIGIVRLMRLLTQAEAGGSTRPVFPKSPLGAGLPFFYQQEPAALSEH
jgi:hypothetical protein